VLGSTEKKIRYCYKRQLSAGSSSVVRRLPGNGINVVTDQGETFVGQNGENKHHRH
jgi:hypothetical protein